MMPGRGVHGSRNPCPGRRRPSVGRWHRTVDAMRDHPGMQATVRAGSVTRKGMPQRLAGAAAAGPDVPNGELQYLMSLQKCGDDRRSSSSRVKLATGH